MTASILLIEKANSSVDWILQSLERKKYKVSLARSEQEAVQKATSEMPDLIILNATSTRMFLFSVELQYQGDLEAGELSLDFRGGFESDDITLSDDLTIETQVAGSKWRIKDNDTGAMYIVGREGEALNIYPGIDGQRTCQALHENAAEIPIILILKDRDVMGATFVLAPPFTSRKLFNRIGRILKSDEGKILLLVEKANSSVDWILQSLEKKKYTVSLARSEQEAVQKATSEMPDLIILNATSTRMFLFSVELQYQGDLEAGELSLDFRGGFESDDITLSDDLTIETQVAGSKWRIKDNDTGAMYIVGREGEALNIYPGIDGQRTCQALHENAAEIPIILILKDRDVMGATFVLAPPFTSRKLFNRIGRILKSDEGKILQVGGLTLSLGTRHVNNGTKERRLNPKEFELLKVFLRSPGRVLSRKFLMKKIWKTDYTGDTRTLDVHIHWLRNKIEKDPRYPVYLRTVRGVGYRFDITPEETNEETE